MNFPFEPNSCDQVIGVAATRPDLDFRNARPNWSFRQADRVSRVGGVASCLVTAGGQLGKGKGFHRAISFRAHRDIPAIEVEMQRRNFSNAAKAVVQTTTLDEAGSPKSEKAGNRESAAKCCSRASALSAITGPAALSNAVVRKEHQACCGSLQAAVNRRDTPCYAWPSVSTKHNYPLSSDNLSRSRASASLFGKAHQ